MRDPARPSPTCITAYDIYLRSTMPLCCSLTIGVHNLTVFVRNLSLCVNTSGYVYLDGSNTSGYVYLDVSNTRGYIYLDVSNTRGYIYLDGSNTSGYVYLDGSCFAHWS